MGVTIREKPPGSGIWWLFINHGGRRKSKKIGTDKKIAKDVAEKVKARLLLGELKVEKINSKAMTFKELAVRWLALPLDLKESTSERYADDLKNHVYPVFGQRGVDTITRGDIKLFFDDLHTSGLKVATLKVIRAPFSQIMAYAVENDLIDINPFDGWRFRYKNRRPEIQPLTEDEASRLLAAAQRFMDGKYHPALLLALRTGMRIGEIQALRWSDIDFDRRTIDVQRSWRKGRTTRTKSKLRRRVDASNQLCEVLKAHGTAEKKKALKSGRPASKLVFTGERDEMLNRIVFKNALNRCCELTGLRIIRIHDLRHSYATMRIMRGHNIGDVSYQLGHSSIQITLSTYVHWLPSKFKNEVDDLDFEHPGAPQAHPENAGW